MRAFPPACKVADAMRTIFGAFLLGAVLTVFTAGGLVSRAHAQTPTTVSPDVKGTVGCGFLGAEIGFAIPAAIGIKELWPYIVFPIVGGAGGALLGYFGVEQGARSPELSVAMLAIGLGLIIPTMVLVLARTAYSPDDDPATHASPANGNPPQAEDYDPSGHGNARPPATPPATTAPTSARDGSHLASAGAGLFRLDAAGLYLGVPAIGLASSFTLDELRDNGLRASDQHAQLRVALLTGSF